MPRRRPTTSAPTPTKRPVSANALARDATSDDEEDEIGPNGGAVRADAQGMTPHLRALLALLIDDDRMTTYHVLKRAVVVNLEYKERVYAEFAQAERRFLQEEVQRIQQAQSTWKQWSNSGTESGWPIFEHLSGDLVDLSKQARVFDHLHAEVARKRKEYAWFAEGSMKTKDEKEACEAMRAALAEAAHALTAFRVHPDIIDSAAELVLCFLNEPTFLQEKYLNFVLAGAPGTGKTSLARAVARLFSAAGMFLGSQTVEASRSDFIGQYLGQTAPKTLSFLLTALDQGVLFIDEAYALCPRNEHGKPDAYGAEFASALVQFMSTYKGLYCIIAAGYREPMERDFLAANEGLPRRFPYRYELANVPTSDLVDAFARHMMIMLGRTPPADMTEPLERYYDASAYEFLRRVIEEVRTASAFEEGPIGGMFINQMGSMTNLAETAATVLVAKRKDVKRSASPPKGGESFNYLVRHRAQRGTNFPTLTVADMKRTLLKHLRNTSYGDVRALRSLQDRMDALAPGASGASGASSSGYATPKRKSSKRRR